MTKTITALLFVCCLSSSIDAQNGYSNFTQQTNRLNALTKSHPQLASLRSLTKTSGGKDIWLLTISAGQPDTKPAIFVAGGVEGNYILSTELAIGFAESLLNGSKSDNIRTLLQKTTFYIAPNLSPDAMEQYFAALQYERQGNATPTDDDRDGKLNEDGLDDLDANGKITWLRVESPTGEYRLHPDDPRVVVRADVGKGEQGKYLILAEGTDNDKDGNYNEDGEGGIWFNRSFTFKHPSFTVGSGEFPVSEKESRAIADFLFDRFNVYAVLSFGSNNNLSTASTYNAAGAKETLVSAWQQADVRMDSMVSELYNTVTGSKDAPKTNPSGGDFFSWAYYHYGRYSFSTPGWWVPKTIPDSTRNEKAFTVEDPGANYLRWAAQQGITNTFTAWKPIRHPDFPNQVVEVGGIDPFVLITPPAKLLPDIVKKNTDFILKMAGYQPDLDLLNLRTEKLGNGLTRVTLDVVNKGAFASHSKIGERSYWVKRIVVKVNTGSSQTIISGKKTQALNSLEGKSALSLSWLIKGSGKLSIEAGSPTTGNKTIDVSL